MFSRGWSDQFGFLETQAALRAHTIDASLAV